jgi:hypothetical protein
MRVRADSVEETTIGGPGTGDILLGGYTDGNRPFSVIGNGNECYYRAETSDLSAWEIGSATYNSGPNSLTRDTVLVNSLGTTAKVNLTGTCTVYLTLIAEEIDSLASGGSLEDLSDVSIDTSLAANDYLKFNGLEWVNAPIATSGGTPGGADKAIQYNNASAFGGIGPLTDGQLVIGSTGATSVAASLTPPAAGITITGGAGTITFALGNDLAALEGMSGTGLVARTAPETYAQRTITGTSNRLSVSNGDGVSGNPTLDIDAAYVGQATITTVGTIGTGTWAGTTVAVNHGGTGQTSYTDGQLLIGNSAGNTLTKATLTAGTNISITNGGGSISIAATGLIAAAGASHPGFVTGRYYSTSVESALSAATGTLNTLYAVPFYVGASTTFTAMAMVTTVAASASAELGVYSNLNGVPDTLLLDAGTVSTVAPTGKKEITGLSLLLAPGWYWLVVAFSANVTARTTPNNSNASSNTMGFAGLLSGTFAFVGCTASWTFSAGNLPGTFPASTASLGPMPMAFIGL